MSKDKEVTQPWLVVREGLYADDRYVGFFSTQEEAIEAVKEDLADRDEDFDHYVDEYRICFVTEVFEYRKPTESPWVKVKF